MSLKADRMSDLAKKDFGGSLFMVLMASEKVAYWTVESSREIPAFMEPDLYG